MNIVRAQAPITFVALMAVWAGPAQPGNEPSAPIFETNVTNDLNITSGEPEIAVDPTHSSHLAVTEFATGSDKMPAATYNALDDMDGEKTIAGFTNAGRVMISEDGGNTWHQDGPPPASDPAVAPMLGGGDPMVAFGPDGSLYVAAEASSKIAPGHGLPIWGRDFCHFHIMIAASRNGGKSWSPPQYVGTPVDRPWMKVDQSTGTVYTASTGPYDPKTGQCSRSDPHAILDRWLVAWQPHLTGKSQPRRIGGPDFSGQGGNTITAAHGVVAATFVLPMGFPGQALPPVPVPESLKPVMKNGVTSCSVRAPCLFFETSTDQGKDWIRHNVPVPGGFATGFEGRVQVSADPTSPGRYTIAVLDPTQTKFLVLVTRDSGTTWSGPVTVPHAAQGVMFKQWMDSGPTGVLALMWKETLAGPPWTPPQMPWAAKPSGTPETSLERAFNVYVTLSCDGGSTWYSPVRVNTQTSPFGQRGMDDLSYLAVDARYVHLVWGDRRLQPTVRLTGPDAFAGVQSWYGRVPFSAITKGAGCGHP